MPGTRWTRAAALVGIDPDVVARLGPRQRQALGIAALCALSPCAWTAAGFGYAIGGLAQSWTIGALAGAGMGLLALNLHRLAVAGGGLALDEPRSAVLAWRPSLVAGAVLGLLGIATAQPLLCWLFQEPMAPVLTARVDALLAHRAATMTAPMRNLREAYAERRHVIEAALAALDREEPAAVGERAAGTVPPLPWSATDDGRRSRVRRRADLERQRAALAEREAEVRAEEERIPAALALYERSLREQSFLVQRILWCWRERLAVSALVTIAIAGRFVLFFVLRRNLRAPIHRYEVLRQARGRRLVRSEHLRTEAERRRWLAAHAPGWAPDPRVVVTPFAVTPRTPLAVIPTVEAATVERLLRDRGDV